jgi:hydroxymethylpyrimidine/phosphomethylpyrimidine kinase
MNKKTVGIHSVLLSIAGFDPSAGAGVALDIKVFENLNFQGMGIITAVTAQNTREIKNIYNLSSQCLEAQFQTLSQDIQILGVKIGMIGSADNLKYIGKILTLSRGIPKVIDPVLQSSSGTWLLEKDAIPIYLNTIKEKATLITPNLKEAHLLTGIKISNISQMQKAAETLYHSLKFPCLIKGGRFTRTVTDLFYDGRRFVSLENEYINKNVHGTGCFLSSGILAFLIKGASLLSACQQGIKLTHQAILQAIPVGQGQELIKL